jgi:hypothetical protein
MPDVSFARMALAAGDPARAKPRLERALALYGDAQPGDPERIGALALLARAELELGDAAAALAQAERAVAQARAAATGFDSTSWLGRALLAQGEAMHARGDARASAVLQEAVAQLDGSLGAGSEASREARAVLAHP